MSHFPHGALIAVHAAQEQKRKQDLEEEVMTNYKNEDLDNNWEFKIVRSSSNAFRKPEVFQGLLEEESVAGWEMIEKLDDMRVRFKRKKDKRRRDATLPPGIDPYRTQFGSSSGSQAAMLILGVVMLLVLGVGVAIFALSGDEFSEALPFFVIIPAIIITLAGFFVVEKVRSR